MQSVAKEIDAYKLWKKVEKTYAQPSAQNVANLIRRLVTLKYKDGSSMSEHINEFEGVANQLSIMKILWQSISNISTDLFTKKLGYTFCIRYKFSS